MFNNVLLFNHVQEKSEDAKSVIRDHKSKKFEQYYGQKKKVNRTKNDLLNIAQKTKN